MTLLIKTMFLVLKLTEASPVDNVAENAIGTYQIRPIFVQDVNRILKHEVFTHQDARNERKAKQMIYIYLDYYGSRYKAITGKEPDARILARIFNGGPNGWTKQATVDYGNRAMNIWRKENDRPKRSTKQSSSSEI
jgi:hypothetical protein